MQKIVDEFLRNVNPREGIKHFTNDISRQRKASDFRMALELLTLIWKCHLTSLRL